MSAVEEFLLGMRAKHDHLNRVLGTVPEAQMGVVGSWGERQMPIRAMVYQLVNHEVEHTVHAMKTLQDLGITSNEVQAILGRLQEARGYLEGLLVGLTDEQFDRAPQGEWSLRQVLEHIMETEDSYLGRIEQAVTKAGSG